MEQAKYIDLLITERDFTLNAGFEPLLCNNRQSITQDIAHSIIESGLATQLVAERSPTLRADLRMQIILLVENDMRLIPGTIFVEEENEKQLWVTADTYDFGEINVGVNYGE